MNQRRIKAFCLDFNHARNVFARPGDFAQADPEEHFAFYEELGANTIQTFAVNCSGYSFFQGNVAPVQPGMKGDFLAELTERGHRAGMLVMGYFCASANRYWAEKNPDLIHPRCSEYLSCIPFTPEYIDYFAAGVADAVNNTGIDGFMLDWLFNGHHHNMPRGYWLDCEIKMFETLLRKKFPGSKNVSAEDELIMDTLATRELFDRVRRAADSAGRKITIWLTSPTLLFRPLVDSGVYRQVDWLMNENANFADFPADIATTARKIQCICGWESHDAEKMIADILAKDAGFYGFAAAGLNTTLLKTLPETNEESRREAIRINVKNVDFIRNLYHRI